MSKSPEIKSKRVLDIMLFFIYDEVTDFKKNFYSYLWLRFVFIAA